MDLIVRLLLSQSDIGNPAVDPDVVDMVDFDMTDVASSIKVGDLFTLEPLTFDAIAANAYLDKCTTCIESEDLCDVLEEILVTLDDPDMPNTPERLRLVNSVQWTALKCSRKSIRLQNKEFKDYIRDIERLNRVPTAASPTSQPKRKTAKRQPASPSKQTPLKKQAKSERKLPPTSTSPRHIEGAESSLWRKGKLQPKRARMRFQQNQSSRRIAPIVIDSQSNATELLDQLGKFCDTPLEGRFENGKLRVFPASAEEHRLIQKYISDKKLRSHTFEMAHNKQLKAISPLIAQSQPRPRLSVPTAAARTLQTTRDAPEIPSTQRQTSQNRRRTSGKSERLRARKSKKKQPTTPSFAEVVKKGTNNSLDAKVMNQMAQMMSNWNANGLKNNLEELKDCIIDYNPDVIGIQETHLRPADRVSIPNYTCHRSDRTTHRGGGTALFVKNSIRHHAILNVSNTFENASIILQLGNNSKITMACIYRPPHGSINTTELDAILIHSNKAFLFGDFNARHPSWNPGRANSNGNILCNWAVGSALDILAPDTPTHFNSRHSNAILDIGFAVNLSHTEVFTINTLSSDHNPVIFDFVTNNALPPILRTLKTTNWIKFQEIISHTIPGNPRIDDLDLAVQNFTSNISNAISASTSTRLITTPHLRLPENIRELIRAKNRFRKL
ncbi:RNA-directed DNA polymerase from mobile element jockey [Trichonephila clavipes]|nr:RNA-directed DNA polymerase from mobile element jockey [Trichonephila clavipes]